MKSLPAFWQMIKVYGFQVTRSLAVTNVHDSAGTHESWQLKSLIKWNLQTHEVECKFKVASEDI